VTTHQFQACNPGILPPRNASTQASLRLGNIGAGHHELAGPHQPVSHVHHCCLCSYSHTAQSYISYRQSYAHHPTKRRFDGGASNGFAQPAGDDTRGLLSAYNDNDGGDTIIEMDLLPPRWIDIQDEVTTTLNSITLASSQLDKLHAKHVLSGFDDEHIKQAEEREIEQLTQQITRGFHNCHKAIKRIEAMVKEAKETGGLHKGDETMASNIRIALAARVQEVSAVFRKKQSNYLNKLRQLGGFESPAGIGRSGTPVPAQNPYTDPALMESDADKSLSQSTLQQTSAMKMRHGNNDVVIAQREQEINDIAKGIIELADIFRDLQAMVIDQGTMLDRIDYNVERMATDVKGAEKELVIATNYQRRNTKRKILLLLLLLVIGMFIVLLIKPKKRSDPPAAIEPPTAAPP
jgi:syntaxin 16